VMTFDFIFFVPLKHEPIVIQSYRSSAGSTLVTSGRDLRDPQAFAVLPVYKAIGLPISIPQKPSQIPHFPLLHTTLRVALRALRKNLHAIRKSYANSVTSSHCAAVTSPRRTGYPPTDYLVLRTPPPPRPSGWVTHYSFLLIRWPSIQPGAPAQLPPRWPHPPAA
jgi:hypothetical protein